MLHARLNRPGIGDGTLQSFLILSSCRDVSRSHSRSDQPLIWPPPLGDVDPLEELIRGVNEAQERDGQDERRLDPKLGERSRPGVRREGCVGRGHSGPRRGGLSRVAVHLLDEIAICSRRRAYSPAAAPLQAILLARNELGNDGCTNTPKVRD